MGTTPLTIDQVLTGSAMIALSSNAAGPQMTVNAMREGGFSTTAIVALDTVGRPAPAQTAEELAMAQEKDRDLKLERANTPSTPQVVIGTSGPSMSRGPG